MEMSLNIARNDSSQSSNEVIDLSWISATNSISDTDTIDTNLVYCLID